MAGAPEGARGLLRFGFRLRRSDAGRSVTLRLDRLAIECSSSNRRGDAWAKVDRKASGSLSEPNFLRTERTRVNSRGFGPECALSGAPDAEKRGIVAFSGL